MPKSKDFFTKLKEQGKINNPDFDKLIEIIPDFEIPDPAVSAFESSFMTLDRAAANKEIAARLKRESLDPVDNEVAEAFEFIREYADPSLENTFKQEGNTYVKLKALKKAIPDAIKKAKGSPQTDEDTKKKLAEYEKTINEFTDKFTKAEKDYNKKLEETNKSWETKFDDFRLDGELQKRANKYTLAESFESLRDSIDKTILSELKSSNHLKYGDKDGRPDVFVYDDEGKPKFNGNTPVIVDNLLEEKYKPFLKKSETPRQDNPKTKTVTQSQTNTRKGASTTVK